MSLKKPKDIFKYPRPRTDTVLPSPTTKRVQFDDSLVFDSDDMGVVYERSNSTPSKPGNIPFFRQHSRRRSIRDTATSPTTPDDYVPFIPPESPSPSKAKKMDSFDPYQVFQVNHLPCMILTVKVICGKNITKGWEDYLDTPDPYISLRVRNAPEGRKRTVTVDNNPNPVWNETFTFLLDIREKNRLQISLMEANLVYDQELGTIYYDLYKMTEGQWMREKFIFNEVSEVYVDLLLCWDKNPTLRYSLCLCDSEKQFLEKRREKAFEGMRKLLGDRSPEQFSEVPNIAVLGSGGGFRAMVALSGVFKALSDTGVLDTVTYACGLSGSSWYLSNLYSYPRWPDMDLGEVQEDLKNNIDRSIMWLLQPQSVYRYLQTILKKRREGQPVSFTDFFGHMVGETLLKGRMDSKLTDQREKINDGDAPMPMYTCVHVKKDVPARSFQEWVEFTPYEIGLPKYGTFLDSELFGSKFFMGKLCKKYEEPPLHFLQGIWGSAFCILFKRLLEDNRRVDPAEMIRQELGKELEMNRLAAEEDSSDCSDEEDDVDDVIPTSTESSDDSIDNTSAPTPTKQVKVTFAPEVEKIPERKRPELKRAESQHKTRQWSYWHNMLKGMVENKNFELLSTRTGRAAVIHNFMRGLSLQEQHLSPFTPVSERVKEGDEFDGIFDMHPTTVKHIYMVDAGLTFNSPYPLVLRPQRNIDIILSFDFSARPSDSTPPFKELLLAEKWAKLNRLSFPPIDPTVFDREGLKELYIFKHPTDPHCPVVMHFCLVNINFRKFSKPGVERTTKEDLEFADFDLFDDPATPYSTFNFCYTHQQFQRLSKLTEFNTLLHIDDIKNVIADKIETKRSCPPRVPFKSKDMKLLRIKSIQERRRLKKYLSRVESIHQAKSPTGEPTSPFFTAPEGLDDVPESPDPMHSDGAKRRRVKLTRQDTVGTLNSITESISLDSPKALSGKQFDMPQNGHSDDDIDTDSDDYEDIWYDAQTYHFDPKMNTVTSCAS
ncbi:cytosolic phospholipase A2-like isoform X1 [Haliotis asinina]|uniref:cytosolic phospholipase A2-like isoform X1 n=2 Tax=Haliotis asinina TaxID=109174 RepID=UPI0035324858